MALFLAGPARAQSTDNTLRGLTVEVSTDGVSFSSVEFVPEFSADQRGYDVGLLPAYTHARLTPTATDAAATVEVGKDGELATVASGSTSAAIPLSNGANAIRIKVTPQTGSVFSLYTMTVWKGGRVVPSRPRNLQAIAGDGKLTLTWAAPAYWGGFPASAYDVDWYAGASPPSDESDWNRATLTTAPLPATATSYEFTGTYSGHTVTNGSTYQLRIHALSQNPDDSGDNLASYWVTVAGTPTGQSLSSNANLSGLTASTATNQNGTYTALNIGTFSASTTSYTATVASTVTHVKLTPTVEDTGKATVTVDGTTVSSGSESGAIALSLGTNAITVRVTAQDSTTKDYTVTITRQAVQSSNANLSGLTASTATNQNGMYTALNIGTFSASTTSYTATVANAQTHAKLTPTVADTGKATVTVDGTTVNSGSESEAIALSVGSNAITVRVTAQDSTTKDYTVTITRQQPPQSSNANLSGLTASTATTQNGTYTALNIGTFAASTTSYTATVANARTHAKLTPTVEDTGKATVTVQGMSVTSGSESGAISLNQGVNAITVRVTAENGTTRDYTVTITREAPPATPTVRLSASPTVVDEGSPVTVTATLSAALSSNVTIPLTVTDDTAEPDDHGTPADITIAAGSTSGTSTITTNQDEDTVDEIFTVALGNLPGSVAAGSPQSVDVTIRDDDGASDLPPDNDDDGDDAPPDSDDPGGDDGGGGGGGDADDAPSTCTLAAPYWSGPSGGFTVMPAAGRTSVNVTCGGRTTEYSAEDGVVTRLVRGSCPGGLRLEGAAPGGWYWQHGERNAAAAPFVCREDLGGPKAVVPGGVVANATEDATWFKHDTARLVGIVPHLKGNECSKYVSPYWQGNGGVVVRPAEGRTTAKVRVQCGATWSTLTASPGADGVAAELVRKDYCTDDEGEAKQGKLTVTGAAPGGWYWIDGERNAAAAPLMCADLLGGPAAVDPGGVFSRATEDGTYFSHETSRLIGVVPHLAPDRDE